MEFPCRHGVYRVEIIEAFDEITWPPMLPTCDRPL